MDVPNCAATSYTLVTDATGSTPYSNSLYSLDQLSGILTITTSSMSLNSIFLKSGLISGAFVVDKVLVTVCGGQQITVADPSNEVFNIVRDATGTSTWITFPLAGVINTQGGGLPADSCPIKSGKICKANNCRNLWLEADGMRLVTTPALAFEVDISIPRDPAITAYFSFTSGSITGSLKSFSLNIKSCAGQTITVVGEAAAPFTREIAKNQDPTTILMFPVTETASWFSVSDPRPGCAIVSYSIYATTNKELTGSNVNSRLWTALDA
jgi:hypothetical protein